MKKVAFLMLAVLPIIAMSGCKEEIVHDVAWFKEHKQELKVQLEKCNNNPGELQKSKNCINATAAQEEEWKKSLFNTPLDKLGK